MAIVFQCECGKEFQVREEDAGRRARCPTCQRELIVPQPKPPASGDLAAYYGLGPARTSGKAIASLVLGLCSFVTCLLTGLPAILFGILGLIDIKNPQKRLTGSGFAIAGIALGSLTSLVSLLMVVPIVLGLLFPAVQSAREAARRATCMNNLKQIALAMHNYESANGCFPPAATYGKDGKPLLSWRVLILPYLGEESLYKQFHIDEEWDSDHNKLLIDRAPAVFRCESEIASPRLASYRVVVDPRSMFTGDPAGVDLKTVTDGSSNTLMVMEATTPVPWSKPEDLSLASSVPMLGIGSKHPGGFNAAMADGAVRFVRTRTIARWTELKALVTRNGGEVMAPP